MGLHHIFFLCFFVILGCNSKDKKTFPKKIEITVLERVAAAHGYANWKKVKEIAFTFNVDRDSSHFERSWIWQPKTNAITHVFGTDTLHYNRGNMDSMAHKANAGFINDRYWLLAPFNLVWDKANFTYEHKEDEVAPISKEPMQKLTIIYGNKGGYTPGDAYDFFFRDDYVVREWVFRKGNQSETSMATTWENYRNIKGFKFVGDHKKGEGDFNLFIDGISVELE